MEAEIFRQLGLSFYHLDAAFLAAPIGLRPGLATLGMVLVVITGSAAAAMRRVGPLEVKPGEASPPAPR